MVTDEALSTAIDTAMGTIADDGELPLAARRTLFRTIDGDWSYAEISAARHVLPIWTVLYPATRPFELISLAERATHDPSLRASLSDAVDQFEPQLEDLLLRLPEAGPYASLMAGFSAVAAGHWVLGNLPTGSGSSELDLDPSEWDASFYAAVAWAGGATWEEVGDPARRREFWTWFLTKAIPAAISRRVIE